MPAPPLVVPELKQKFDVLLRYTSLRNRTELGRHFGIGEGGIRDWERKSAGKEAGAVPSKHHAALMRILRDYVPGQRSDAELRGLLIGSLADFSAAMLSESDGNWSRFLENEAEDGELKLILTGRKATSFGPLRIEVPPPENVPIMLPGESYSFKFETKFRTTAPFRVFALQRERGQWEFIELRAGATLVEGSGREVTAPTLANGRDGTWIVDHTARGNFDFVAVALQDVLPDGIRQTILQGGTIDGGRLDALAHALSQLDPRKRRVVMARRYAPWGPDATG